LLTNSADCGILLVEVEAEETLVHLWSPFVEW